MEQARGEHLFTADWDKVLMMHFSVDAHQLQREVPFELDLRDGQAFVTLVAFTMREMRPARGGSLTSCLLRPMATHDFLNVRTYVRARFEVGIHFLAEWVSNRLAVALGPRLFSLPYRHGRITYQNDCRKGGLRGQVADLGNFATFAYQARLQSGPSFATCAPGSLDEWLMERYSAHNRVNGSKRFFRVWHPPWPQCTATVKLEELALLERNWPWFAQAQFTSANYSPGVRDVWLGRPHRAE